MPEIDFYTFGIVSNDPLLERINAALDERYAFGDFTLRSAWLYHGTKRAAAQALEGFPYLFVAKLSHDPSIKGWALRLIRCPINCGARVREVKTS